MGAPGNRVRGARALAGARVCGKRGGKTLVVFFHFVMLFRYCLDRGKLNIAAFNPSHTENTTSQ